MFHYEFTVPYKKQYRVIIHTDCKNEADDQFTVAHALMTPKLDIKAIIAGHFEKNNRLYGAGAGPVSRRALSEILPSDLQALVDSGDFDRIF